MPEARGMAVGNGRKASNRPRNSAVHGDEKNCLAVVDFSCVSEDGIAGMEVGNLK